MQQKVTCNVFVPTHVQTAERVLGLLTLSGLLFCSVPFRVQRCAMLQFLDFHEKLLDALCRWTEGSPATEHAQSLILDILCWLAGVFSNGPCR